MASVLRSRIIGILDPAGRRAVSHARAFDMWALGLIASVVLGFRFGDAPSIAAPASGLLFMAGALRLRTLHRYADLAWKVAALFLVWWVVAEVVLRFLDISVHVAGQVGVFEIRGDLVGTALFGILTWLMLSIAWNTMAVGRPASSVRWGKILFVVHLVAAIAGNGVAWGISEGILPAPGVFLSMAAVIALAALVGQIQYYLVVSADLRKDSASRLDSGQRSPTKVEPMVDTA